MEVFLDMLRHKWLLSEANGADVGLAEAVRSYLDEVLPEAPAEKVVIPSEDELDAGWIGFG